MLDLLHPQVRKLVEASGVIVRDLATNEYDDNDMVAWAYWSVTHDYIGINVSMKNVADKIDVIVLHELIHWTGSGRRLARKLSVSWENAAGGSMYDWYLACSMEKRHTEELTAQLGMYKIGVMLGLDDAYLFNELQLYKAHFPLGDWDQAAKESDEAVKYLSGFMEKSLAA